MIIGIEMSRTQDENGKKFYRIAPVVIHPTKDGERKIKAYLVASFFIFAFMYYTTQVAVSFTGSK